MMALSCVVLDKGSNEFSLSLVSSFFVFGLHSCGRPELHQSCYLAPTAGYRKLQRQYDITTECEVRRLTLSPNQMVTQGAPRAERAAVHSTCCLMRLLSLSPFLSTDVHVYTGV